MKLPKHKPWSEMITKEYAVCEICHKKYQSVSTHIRQAHKINDIQEYKREYGYNKNQPLESGNLQEKRRQNALEKDSYKNIKEIIGKYQFVKGDERISKPREYNEQFVEMLKQRNIHENRQKDRIQKRIKKLKARAKIDNPIKNIPLNKRNHKRNEKGQYCGR